MCRADSVADIITRQAAQLGIAVVNLHGRGFKYRLSNMIEEGENRAWLQPTPCMHARYWMHGTVAAEIGCSSTIISRDLQDG
jgi:hypothetical protein